MHLPSDDLLNTLPDPQRVVIRQRLPSCADIFCGESEAELNPIQFLRSIQLRIKIEAERLCLNSFGTIFNRQIKRLIIAGIRKQAQALIEQRAEGVLFRFGIVQHRNVS